jgi:hypothetical protein
MWLQHGDKNTKYFHMRANIRRQKNKIESIRDGNGQCCNKRDKIEQVFVEHFQNLFQSQPTHNINETVEVVKGSISKDMAKNLSKNFTKE